MYVARTEDFNPTHIVQVPHISYTIHIAAYSVNEKICKGHCNERTDGLPARARAPLFQDGGFFQAGARVTRRPVR